MTTSTITYALQKLKIDDYWNRGITGSGIKIGIVDDGMTQTNDALVVSGGYACGNHTTYYQEAEHPAHCAGIALAKNLDNGEPTGVAPDAELYAIRMYYRTYTDRVNSLIEAIDYAVDNGIDILSMSIHITENSFFYGKDGRESSAGCPKHMRIAMREAFYKAYLNDIIIVVAAGNHNDGSGRDNIEFEELLPKMPNVITVANLTMSDKRYYTSGVGKWVDCASYGFRIKSTIPNNSYGHLTGTSMSTPSVAGILALYKQLYKSINPNVSANDVINKMLDNCEKVPELSEKQQGKGVPQPPRELFDIDVSIEVENQFRIRDYATWKPCQVFENINGDWVELEAMGNE